MAVPIQIKKDDLSSLHQAPNHKRSSSSSFNQYDLRNDSPLLDLGIYSADQFPNGIDRYNLKMLCPQYSGKDEEILLSYLRERFKDEIAEYKFDTSSDQEVKSLNVQANFLTSIKFRPDVTIASCKKDFPLLFVEIVSSDNYLKTVFKLTVNLIDQLRFLRNYCDISSLFGYVFPNSDTTTLVAMVQVEWKDLKFRVRYEHLGFNSVFDDFLHQCKDLVNTCKIDDPAPALYFVRLSKTDLETMKHAVGSSSTLKQCVSKFSILTSNDKFYYKILPQLNEEFTMMNIFINTKMAILQGSKLDNYSHIVFPDERFQSIESTLIWRFPAQPCQPLKISEAKKCLGDLVNKVCIALEELHQFGYAHCDVRIPNICFTNDGEVRLIDLDRAKHVTKLYPAVKVMECVSLQKSIQAKEHDYIMLGLMILLVLDDFSPGSSLVGDQCREIDTSGFAEHLIVEHVCQPSLLEKFVLNNPGKVVDVLSSRLKKY